MPTVRYTTVAGEVIAEKRGGVRRQYVPDPLGSTVALLDNTQAVTDTFSYWPYGEERTRTGSTSTPFRFVGTRGYYRDSASRSYVRARYLDVANTRWMTKDPMEFNGRDWNLYRYAADNPITAIDPSGRVTIIGCSRDKREAILKHLRDLCGKRLHLIPSETWRQCLNRRCQSGVIHCRNSNDPNCL